MVVLQAGAWGFSYKICKFLKFHITITRENREKGIMTGVLDAGSYGKHHGK